MKKSFLFFTLALFLYACGGGGGDNNKTVESLQPADDGKGYGEITEVKLNETLNADMVERGRAIYDMKCSACHKLTAQRVVGPGWAGLTEKRKPEWIMNMITNVDVMLAKDPTAQKLLEECLTRMPNQNVSVGDARDLLEFIYQNDLDKKSKS
jgi:mono/diheme cytochrome c family protein